MLPDDRKFHDSIAAKTYKATKADREAQTKDLKSKLEELKQPDEVKMRLVNEPSDLAAAFFAMLHGKDGDDGKTPEKGKDYFTDDEAQDFLKRATPEKGVHYMTPDEVSEMLRQATPIKGTHYFDGDKGDKGNPGRDGADGVGLKGDKGNPGAPGKRGSPDTGADIKEKLSGLSGSERLHISSIDGIGEFGESFLQQAKALVPRSLSGMYDMNLRGLADGDTIVWNQATHKWIPGTGGGSGSLVIGTTPITGGSVGDVLKIGAGGILASGAVSGTGTVTSVSVVTANGVSGSVATATTTPAITLTLGAITPSSVAATGLISATVNSTTSVGYSFAADSTTGLGYVTGNLLLYQSGKLSLVLTDALLNFRIPSNYTYSWAGNIANNVGADTGMSRLSAGSLAVGNGTSGDTSGSLTAASFVGALTGNASTATKLATARTIAGTSFDGSANIALANKFIVQGTTDAGLSGAQFLGALATGIVKNTTSTGVLSIAVAGDFPTLNQSTTGSAATLTTPRAINGVNFDGSAPITVPAAAGTLTGTTLNASVVTSSLTSVGMLTSGTASAGFVLGGVTTTLGSDATGDLYYRNSSGVLTRLGIGSSTNVLTVSGGLPTWAAAGGGSSAWSSLTNPTANLSLATSTYTTAFSGTGGWSITNTTARVGGFAYPPSSLGVYGNHAYNDGSGTFGVYAQSNTLDLIYMGYDTTAGFGYVQSFSQGNSTEPLILNPIGGNVGIGGGGATPNALFQLDNPNALSTTYGSVNTLWIGDQAGTLNYKNGVGFGFHSGTVTVPTNFFGVNTATLDGTGPYLSYDFVWAARLHSQAYNTAPTETMRLTSAGNLGINDVAPAAKLSVVGGAQIGFSSGQAAPTNGLIVNGHVSIGSTNSTQLFSVGSSAGFAIGLGGVINTYSGVVTAGNLGVPAIYGYGRSTAQTAAVTSVATYTASGDGSYYVSANVNVTAAATASFQVTCSYTDETNTSRVAVLSFSSITGTFLNTITNVTGTGAYEGIPLHIRAKNGTTITIATTGTFTSVTYNVEGAITEID